MRYFQDNWIQICILHQPGSLEQKMGHKKMFNGTEVNQRRSDKQNFGFVATNGQVVNVTTSMGNSSGILTVRMVEFE